MRRFLLLLLWCSFLDLVAQWYFSLVFLVQGSLIKRSSQPQKRGARIAIWFLGDLVERTRQMLDA